jgi:predicted O-methyltransferase YrrM
MHPVPRRYDDNGRKRLREKLKPYQEGGDAMPQSDGPANAGLLLTVPILARMRAIEGWLEDAEANLLIVTAAKALSELPEAAAMVEIGSYCGRSTVVLGSVLRTLRGAAKAKLYAIDPHDGQIGALDQGLQQVAPTFETFQRNIAAAGLDQWVEPVRQCSFQVAWSKPIGYLFIDGLHDYANVARDFDHFERWVTPGGYVAFHDYADYYPGVKTFVNALLNKGDYEKVHCALSMMVLRKRPEVAQPLT